MFRFVDLLLLPLLPVAVLNKCFLLLLLLLLLLLPPPTPAPSPAGPAEFDADPYSEFFLESFMVFV
jgi:hypothetical protein